MTDIAQERAAPARVDEQQSTKEQVKEKVQDAAGQAHQQAGEKAQQLRGKAADSIRQQLDSRSTQAGEQVTATADALRRASGQLREDGNAAPARYAEQAAQPIDRLGRYLTESDGERILRDADRLARQRPFLTVLGGATLGFLVARFIKASSTTDNSSIQGGGQAPNALPQARPAQGGPDVQSSN